MRPLPRFLLRDVPAALRQDACDLADRLRSRAEHVLCDLAWRVWFGPRFDVPADRARQDSRPAARSVPATHEGRAAGREADDLFVVGEGIFCPTCGADDITECVCICGGDRG